MCFFIAGVRGSLFVIEGENAPSLRATEYGMW